ncbi:hypothetical protein DFH09DRAFT_1045971 [Mycena vulgaris]|nr:hypothetical protein DFH09DRAFT_1045971 [Mycena vulgaris]
MASSPSALKAGWVSVKEDGLFARWNRKWLHLGKTILVLQRPPLCLPDLIILLNNIINIERTDLKPYCLLLETHQKRFFLSLKNDNDLYDWYDSIYRLSSFNDVSNPTNFIHKVHVRVDPVTQELKDMPDQWVKLLEKHRVPTREDIAKDPLLASDILDIRKERRLKVLVGAGKWQKPATRGGAGSPYSAQDTEDVVKIPLSPVVDRADSTTASSSPSGSGQQEQTTLILPIKDKESRSASIRPLSIKGKKMRSAAQTKPINNLPDDTSATSRDSTSPVDIILYNHEQRASLLKQGLSPVDLRNALQACYQHIYTALLTVVDSRDIKHAVLLLEGDRAQSFLDAVQDVLDKGSLPSAQLTSQARRLIQRLSEACDKLPSSLFITGIVDHDEHPTFVGGFGDIYRASHNGNTVAVKRIRMFSATSDSQRTRLQFCREALVWQRLQHKYVLPLIGIDRESFPSSFCLVSPWMKHGTVLKYLTEHGRDDLDKMLLQVAEGLSYLHSMNIVHGDLRGTNILVSDDWNACLADFGLTTPRPAPPPRSRRRRTTPGARAGLRRS